MKIERIDQYNDNRFLQTVLDQHGAYLADGEPYQILITDSSEAVVSGPDPAVYGPLIEEFRFHAPHITRFYSEQGIRIAEYPAPDILEIPLGNIQPSQFFIDEEKLKAVQSFVRSAEDIVIQVIPYGERFISLDGHTRLYLAVRNGFHTVKAVCSETDDWVWPFVREAEQRNIRQPGDMILLPHEQYEIRWNQYCDTVFASLNETASGNEGDTI